MSKFTIATGAGFYLYHEEMPFQKNYENHVWLEMENVEFEARSQRITVKIPVAVWEYLRGFPGIDLGLSRKSDDEILAEADAWVDRHIKDVKATEEPKKSVWYLLAGLSPLGPPESTRAEQLRRAIEYLMERREYERNVCAAIEELKSAKLA